MCVRVCVSACAGGSSSLWCYNRGRRGPHSRATAGRLRGRRGRKQPVRTRCREEEEEEEEEGRPDAAAFLSHAAATPPPVIHPSILPSILSPPALLFACFD